MRLRAVMFAILALGGVGAAAWQAGVAASGDIERRTAVELRAALADAGLDWADIATDGLIVTLSGTAPGEAERLRALEAVHGVVGIRRIEDRTTQRAAAAPPAPAFAIELLRNHDDISLIGLAPEPGTRERIRDAMAGAGLSSGIADMLQTAAHASPPGWDASLDFALAVLADNPRARVAVSPGTVTVTAVLADDAARAAMETRLAARVPAGVALELELSAPRPGIAPFRLDFRLEEGRGHLVSCSAETEGDADEIMAAARAAGLAGEASCALGLGAPSDDWAAAAARGIEAVNDLGGGGFALTDSRAELTGPAGIGADALAAAAGSLADALPAGYVVNAVMPASGAAQQAAGTVYAPRFDAVLGADGALKLTGSVHDAVSQAAIQSYASALFGHDRVQGETVIDPGLPDGWPVRVLAGIEALAEIAEGSLAVTPERIVLSGRSLDADADARVEALLAAKAAGMSSVMVRFDALAAARAADAARPAPERCADEIGAILETETIDFRPGSTEISPESQGVIAAIADVLHACPGAEFEVAGHTDSSGSAEANQRLSEDRAAEVAAVLRNMDLPMIGLHPRGYGAERPLGDNTTPEGRALNRRIEILLRDPSRVEEEQVAALPATRDTGVADDTAGAAGADCAAEVAGILTESAVQFELGSATISAESADVITALAEALRACGSSGMTFEVAGHTDDRGPADFNMSLSERRAEAVRTALAAEEIEGIELVARGYGPERPLADNDTQEGRARNRRIEITLVPDAGGDAARAEVVESEVVEPGDGPD